MENFSPLVRYDQTLLCTSSPLLIGADEVGRGSWVGPVVAAAVHIPADLLTNPPAWLHLLNDSKLLKHDQRVTLSDQLKIHTLFSLAEASLEEIEQINLHHASLLAIYRAVADLQTKLQLADPLLLIDGCYRLPQWQGQQQPMVKGDGQSAHIAAASIIAKVHRDALLSQWHENYPHYAWASNKGYGTKPHLAALSQYGPCPLHRPRFLKKWQASQVN